MNGGRNFTRRGVVQLGLGVTAGLVTQRLLGFDATDPRCERTPDQVRGPFYPMHDQADEDVDLTIVHGRSGRAEGAVIHVRGQVLDEGCAPIAGALVEIWQANTWGRYHHEADAGNPRPVDPNFQGWGETLTDQEGRYGFKTILPAGYPVEPGWTRPPHIHFRIAKRGYHELITQMYFAGQELNEKDRLLQALPSQEQERLIVNFRLDPTNPNLTVGTFDIGLRRV